MTFPLLAKLIEKGKVATRRLFGVASGDLSVMDKTTGEFKPVRTQQAAHERASATGP